jgi:hypothetical protein
MTTKELRKISRDTIEYETSFSINSILNIDRKKSTVQIECTDRFNGRVILQTRIIEGKIEITSPGQGTILVQKIK